MIDMGRLASESKGGQPMMGKRDFETKLYYNISLDRLVPQDHLLRRIAAAIDFSFVRPLCRPYYSHTGQPSVDPVVIFKMMLLGYLYGIASERRLAEEMSLHLGYRWFLGYDFDVPTPDHSVLSKARKRFGAEVFKEFFRQSIELCGKAGLLEEEGPVYVDSTLIRAGASVDSLRRREDLLPPPPLSVTEYLERLDQEAEADQGSEPPALEASSPGAAGNEEEEDGRPSCLIQPLRPEEEPSGLPQPPSLAEYRQRLGRETAVEEEAAAEQKSEPVQEGPEPAPGEEDSTGSSRPLRPNEEFLSRTDPDATLVDRPDFGRHLAYKAHLAMGGKRGQVVTAAIATTGAAADEHHLADLLWEHHQLSGLGIPAAVADAKYGTSFNFLYLGRLGIPAFIPLTRFGVMRKDIWGREHFQWLPDEHAYVCPAGQKLSCRSQDKGTQRVKYQASKGTCAVCPFRTQCTPSGRERTVGRSWGQDYVDRTAELLAKPIGKECLIERKICSEGAFGLAKELHGLRRTRFKGRWRVQIQVWLRVCASTSV